MNMHFKQKRECLRCDDITFNFPGNKACCGPCLGELAAMHRDRENRGARNLLAEVL